jgi:hypothetical protein
MSELWQGVNDLTDLDFDEISFVPKGANQKANVVLFKAEDVPEGYAISTRALAKAAVVRKYLGNVLLAERAEARLSELRKAEPLTTYEQAVAVVLDENPELYQP